jgi:hypothetical protein
MSTSYRELERRFIRLITQPRPLLTAAHDLLESEPGILPLSNWIAAPSEDIAVARLGIYAHMYFARLRDSLRDDFELFARLVSPTLFARLAARYLERHPSDDPSLRHHGRHFPEFLRREIANEDRGFVDVRPDAPDLCRLEWERIEVFDAPSSTPLQRERLVGLAPEAWAGLEVALAPTVRLVNAGFAVSALWSALEVARTPPRVLLRPERLLVWRRGFQVFHRAIDDDDEWRALLCLRQGALFSAVCECFDRDAEANAERALSALLQWIADEIVIEVPCADRAIRNTCSTDVCGCPNLED